MNSTSMQKTARIAGLLYLLQIPLGVFGMVYVPKTLIVDGDIAATASNISAHEFLFRLGMVSIILSALVTIATAQYISKVLSPVHRQYARWILIFTLILTPIFMLNELNNVAVLLLVTNPDFASVFAAGQIQQWISVFLDLHKYGLHIAGIFFGLWLLPMGFLVFKSTYIPKIIGVFLMITSLGYLIDFLISFLYPDFGVIISEYTWLGEVMMVLWLLIKGVNVDKFEKWNESSV